MRIFRHYKGGLYEYICEARHSETEEEMDLNYVKDEGIEKDVDVVMTNSLGFGGHNATLIVRKYS